MGVEFIKDFPAAEVLVEHFWHECQTSPAVADSAR
jgi:hypothetical protein